MILAIAMRVPSVRIVAPIPGKNSVGVEVPERRPGKSVRLRQVMEQSDKADQEDEDSVVPRSRCRRGRRWSRILLPCPTC